MGVCRVKNKVISDNDKLAEDVIYDLVEITEPWYEWCDGLNTIVISMTDELDKWKFLFDICEITEETFNRAKKYLDIGQEIAAANYKRRKLKAFPFIPSLKQDKESTFELPKINDELEYLNLFLKHKFFYKETYSFLEKEDAIFIHTDNGLKKIRKYHKKNDDG